jgi:hypothetical protein
MGTFRLRRKTFGFVDEAVHAKSDNWEITKDVFKNEGTWAGIQTMFGGNRGALQRSADRLAANGKRDVAERLVSRQNRLGIGGKIKLNQPQSQPVRTGVPSTNASIAMGAPAGPSIGGTGAGVGGY